MDDTSLTARKCIVTGASRGIGRAVAMTLVRKGADVVVTGRDEIALRHFVQEATGGETSGSTRMLVHDLLDEDAPERLVEDAARELGGIDTLINNAGIAANASVEETDAAEWDRLMGLNARAPFLVCRAALPYLRDSTSPVIINMSSVVGRHGYARQAAYSASKHALMGFTKALARELQPAGIRVHAIAPGGVATEMIARVRPDIPQEELIAPEEIADIVVFLLTRTGTGVIDEINIRRAASTPWQ